MKAAAIAAILLSAIANANAEDRSLLLRISDGEGYSQQATTWHNRERSRFVETSPHVTLPPRRLGRGDEREYYYMTPRGVCGDGGRLGPEFQTGNC